MYRALATANAFARNGWRVTVLTATRDTFERLTGSDPDAERAIDPSINVVRVPFDPQRGESNLAVWSRARVFSPLLWNYLRSVRARFGFPEAGYASWQQPLIAAAKKIHAADAVDLVVGSANPNVDFAPGRYLFLKYGVPYVMDHRDAWNMNVYTGRRVGTPMGRSNRLERAMLADSSEAWFVNKAIRDWHAEEYPDRADDYHVVANGFDPIFLDGKSARVPDPEQLVFGYLGTIYGPIPLRESLEGWRLARSRSELLRNAKLVFRGRLGHFAEPDAEAAALLREFADDNVSYEGPVSKTQVTAVYASFDAVLLIISRSRFVTSGKVFEYAGSGLPIAALHHPETAATGVLAGHPARFSIDEVTPEEIAKALIATGERAVSMSPEDREEARAWAQHLARDEQLLPRIEALRSKIKGDPA